jgi:hypothetical protein
MGAYHKYKKPWIFLAVSILLGAMLQLHYQFVLVVFGVAAYYFLVKREKFSYIFLFLLGLCIGFSPLILFEVRNQFYNTNTILLFLKNLDKVDKPGGAARSHYYLTISLFLYLAALAILNKLYILYSKRLKLKKSTIKKGILWLLTVLNVVLISLALVKFIPHPRTAFWAGAQDWNYLNEVQIYKNIKSTGLTRDYNVSNLVYDTKAEVPKYLLRVDNVGIEYEEYWHNKYLFVIEETKKDYRLDPAYEVKYFAPAHELKRWALNDAYSMYLLERDKETP